MGSTEDPPDGPAVAATVFTAVIVYAVCTPPNLPVLPILCSSADCRPPFPYNTGLPHLLRLTSMAARPRKPARRNSAIVTGVVSTIEWDVPSFSFCN
jgi:hypothetical protein